MVDEYNYWLGFSVFPGVGSSRFKLLLDHFGSAEKAWNASASELLESGLGEALTAKFELFRAEFSFEKYLNLLEQKNVSCILLTDTQYPRLLKQIEKAPFVLYVKGSIDALQGISFDYAQEKNIKTIGIVGTRKITQYGRDATTFLTQELVQSGFTVVSGLAYGVDTVAHTTTIAQNGITIAVLGSGVDLCTPPINEPIYNSILDSGGVIVSEVPVGIGPSKGSFPARNRIIAGLSQGVIVTEGAEDSGALITADYAFQFNRKVFAVPGSITSGMSKGPYKLIQKGAKLVTSGEDILKEFQISNIKFPIPNKKEIKGETEEEQRILDLLQNEALSLDQIVRETGMHPSQVGSLLSLMEIKGMIKSVESGIFEIMI